MRRSEAAGKGQSARDAPRGTVAEQAKEKALETLREEHRLAEQAKEKAMETLREEQSLRSSAREALLEERERAQAAVSRPWIGLGLA